MLQGQRIWLMPQEMVYIPFKFQAWQHGVVRLDNPHAVDDLVSSEGVSPREIAAQPIGRRSIAVSVLNVTQEQVMLARHQDDPPPTHPRPYQQPTTAYHYA